MVWQKSQVTMTPQQATQLLSYVQLWAHLTSRGDCLLVFTITVHIHPSHHPPPFHHHVTTVLTSTSTGLLLLQPRTQLLPFSPFLDHLAFELLQLLDGHFVGTDHLEEMLGFGPGGPLIGQQGRSVGQVSKEGHAGNSMGEFSL